MTDDTKLVLDRQRLGRWTIITSSSGLAVTIAPATRKRLAILVGLSLAITAVLVAGLLLPLLNDAIEQRFERFLQQRTAVSYTVAMAYHVSCYVAIAAAVISLLEVGFLLTMAELRVDTGRSQIRRSLLWGLWHTDVSGQDLNEIQLRVEVEDKKSLDQPGCRLQFLYGNGTRQLIFASAFPTFSADAICLLGLVRWLSAEFKVPIRLVFAPWLRGRGIAGSEAFLAALATLDLREPIYLS